MKRLISMALTALLLLVAPAFGGGDWNDSGIKWMSYDEGLAAAKKEKKPILLVLFTEWCPHCTNYAKQFHDPKVIEKSKQFVMIRVESDKRKDISSMYKPDGEYIPRTFFLSSNGEMDPSLDAGRPKYKYFYDENSPAGILAGMDRALAKLK
ncbi:MAG TPA: thioredoxin family protein [Terriglobales bacterium]|nr:thioredoxin family protein [Terriglobales bacterium]